jgi:hypothetical protein
MSILLHPILNTKKGVEIVKETIAIYNKMESPCHPERSQGTPVILSEAKELP